jgi:hypothetical protein
MLPVPRWRAVADLTLIRPWFTAARRHRRLAQARH